MRILFVALALTMIPVAATANISGIYVANGKDYIEAIHLVEGKNGDLVGQFEIAEIKRSDKVKITSRNLTGSIRNNAIAIKLEVPIADWFTSTTLTGTASRRVLTLSYAGKTAKYKKTDMSGRDAALGELNAAALKRLRDKELKRAGDNLAVLIDNVGILEKRTDSDVEWFAEQKRVYSELFFEGRKIEEKIEQERRLRLSYERVLSAQDTLLRLNDKVRTVDDSVRDRSVAIRNIRIKIDYASKALHKFCSAEASTRHPEICSAGKDLETRFQVEIKRSRQAFDDLILLRSKVTL